jgi:thiamine biosynthesis lipoprotein
VNPEGRDVPVKAVVLPGARRVEHLMGMVIGIDVRDALEPSVLETAIEEVFAWLHWVDATFSTYRPDSQISRFGRGELSLAACCADVRWVLDRCEELRTETGGYFDARANPRRALDPSGLVKGWAVERASALLAAAGAVNHCINAAGDIRTRGEPEPGRSWHVGVVHPLHRDALCALLAVGDAAVATSGVAERGQHVFDPHTGTPVSELASVTVIAADLAHADTYATAALAMGAAAPAWLAGLVGSEALVIDPGGYAWETPGFHRYTMPEPQPEVA